MLKRLFPSASLAFFMLAGCASDPAPTAQLQLSEQAVAQARSMEASRAHEELALAELDARLAEARVLKDQRQAQIDDLNRRIQRLRQQLGEVR